MSLKSEIPKSGNVSLCVKLSLVSRVKMHPNRSLDISASGDPLPHTLFFESATEIRLFPRKEDFRSVGNDSGGGNVINEGERAATLLRQVVRCRPR